MHVSCRWSSRYSEPLEMEEPMKRKGGVQVAEALADLPCPV